MVVDVRLADIEPSLSAGQWLTWLAEESTPTAVRHRFGDDEEALVYWPDDYYEKMSLWWSSPRCRKLCPVEVRLDDRGVVRILDGWHRVALSRRLGLTSVPCRFSPPEAARVQ